MVVTQVSLAFGLSVAAIVSVIGPVSGGTAITILITSIIFNTTVTSSEDPPSPPLPPLHASPGHINPAVSVGLLAGGQLPLLHCLLYVLSQCVGATLGAALLHAATPAAHRATLGANALGEVDPWAGLLLEAALTMLLLLVVYSTAVDARREVAPGLAPLVIGAAVAAAHLVLVPYTGTSINPARSLGPAVVGGRWAHHWVFWAGPLVGGTAGGLLYTHLFHTR